MTVRVLTLCHVFLSGNSYTPHTVRISVALLVCFGFLGFSGFVFVLIQGVYENV